MTMVFLCRAKIASQLIHIKISQTIYIKSSEIPVYM